MAVEMEPAGVAGEESVESLVALDKAAFKLAARVLGSPEEAEDVVQQAYLEAVAQIRAGGPPADQRTWFMRVVANRAKNHLRNEARRRRREAAVSQPASNSTESDGEVVNLLRREMDSLDSAYRLPLALCYEDGFSQREAATILGVPESTISHRLHEGLEMLRGALAKAGYAAAPAAVVGGLKLTSPAVPAGLTAMVKGLVAGGAAAYGKTASGAALKASARLGAKKAAGLALGWKVAAVAAVAVVSAGAYSALRSGKPEAPTVAAPAGAVLPPEVIYEDEFKGGPLSSFWETARNARIGGQMGPQGLCLEPGTPGVAAEVISKEIMLGGRPLELAVQRDTEYMIPGLRVDGNQAIRGLEILTGSGRQLVSGFVRVPGDDGREAVSAGWTVEGKHVDGVFYCGVITMAPSGQVVFSTGESFLKAYSPGPRGVLGVGRLDKEVKSVRLRLHATNSGIGFSKVVVRRLEAWPKGMPVP